MSKIILMTDREWTQPDENELIDVPDHLMPLMNKIGNLIRFHTISGIGETITVARMVRAAEQFFVGYESSPEKTES